MSQCSSTRLCCSPHVCVCLAASPFVFFSLPEQPPLHIAGEEAGINLHRTTFDPAVRAPAKSHSHSHAAHTVVQRVGLGPIGIGKGLEEECFGSHCAIVVGGSCRGGTGLCVGRSWERGEESHVLPVLLLAR